MRQYRHWRLRMPISILAMFSRSRALGRRKWHATQELYGRPLAKHIIKALSEVRVLAPTKS